MERRSLSPSGNQSNDGVLGTTASEKNRTSNACTVCRNKKVKCSGDQPCAYCAKRDLTCVFVEQQRKRRISISEVHELQKRVAFYERQRNAAGPLSPNLTQESHDTGRAIAAGSHAETEQNTELIFSNPASHGDHREDISAAPLSTLSYMSPVLEIHPRPFNGTPNTDTSIAANLELASSQTFGTAMRSVLGQTQAHHARTVTSPSPRSSSSPNNLRQLGQASDVWPTESDANYVLDTLISYVSCSQHFFDPRSVSDRFALMYQSKNRGHATPIRTLDAIQLLLVLANGKLILGSREHPHEIPGETFFAKAENLFPKLRDLQKEGVLAIEVMGLAALYLQSSNRKDEAYIHISTALRLAVVQRLYRATTDENLPRSEAIHRNRVFWTIYMLERRLGAATGNPPALEDTAITVLQPQPYPGFSSVAAMNININVARVTGKIMSTIYVTNGGSEVEFVAGIQHILATLHDIGRNIPDGYQLDFSRPLNPISRVSASLHIMLFQAVILAIRPVLLHLAKSFEDSTDTSSRSTPTILRNLVGTCVEAARKSVEILKALHKTNLLNTFGFFDLDATFSAAFVLLIAHFLDGAKRTASASIEDARGLLDVMAKGGNLLAAARADDVGQMAEHILVTPPNTGIHAQQAQESVSAQRTNDDQYSQNHPPQPQQSSDQAVDRDLEDQIAESQSTLGNLPPFSGLDSFHNDTFQFYETDASGASLINESADLYRTYHDAMFDLTGADDADWDIFSRQVAES